jgi:predicted neuraminidase
MYKKKIQLLMLLISASLAFAAEEINISEYTVFDGNKGWDCNGITYKLACAALVVDCPNGDLLCGWLSGSAKEPATDNCFLISRSKDGGKTWLPPQILIPSGEMAGIVTNIHKTTDGIIAFGAYWPAEKEYTEWHYFKIESADNGQTWSAPARFDLHNKNGFIGPGPISLPDGKFLYVGGFFDKRQKPITASVKEIAFAKNEEQAQSMKSFDPNDKASAPEKFGRYLHGCCAYIADNNSSINFSEHGYIANRPLGLLEPTAIMLKDGTIAMLMRAEWGGFLWRSDSKDKGKTWSIAYQTDIPNPSSLTYLIRLPDGRIGLIHNPSGGKIGQRGPRNPMSLWISNDEMKTWKVKKDLLTDGKLAYPCGLIYIDKLVFVYDKNRREVKFVQVETGLKNAK